MQEQLDEQMLLAEENGDVHKMPLSIKQVIDDNKVEKSQAQNVTSKNIDINRQK